MNNSPIIAGGMLKRFSLTEGLVQNAVGDNNNQYSMQNSNQASFSGNLNQWIYHLKEKILSHMFDNMNLETTPK